MIVMSLSTDTVRKAIVFLGCSVHPFVWLDIVTTISRERVEQLNGFIYLNGATYC